MSALAQVNKYLTNHYEGMEPKQLILLLFKGALDRITLTRQGIAENNLQKRGENLSKVIAIVSELHASLDPGMNDEGTQFLRGLYAAILAELPKVSIKNDTTILDRTESYINKLKDIWETDVMGLSQNNAQKPEENRPIKKNPPTLSSYKNNIHAAKQFNSFSV